VVGASSDRAVPPRRRRRAAAAPARQRPSGRASGRRHAPLDLKTRASHRPTGAQAPCLLGATQPSRAQRGSAGKQSCAARSRTRVRSWRPARGWSPPYPTQALPVTLRDELQATVAGGHDRVASTWSPANTRKVRPSHECSAKVAERTPPLRAPREYTPRHLAEKILQSRSALEGERKQVTVVFADVKGSMELAEQL